MTYIILVFIIITVSVLIYFYKTYSKKQIQKFLSSERYKSSKYVVQLINNDYYVVKCKDTETYVDLADICFTWYTNSVYFKDCKGTLRDCVRAIKELEPNARKPEKITSVIEL